MQDITAEGVTHKNKATYANRYKFGTMKSFTFCLGEIDQFYRICHVGHRSD